MEDNKKTEELEAEVDTEETSPESQQTESEETEDTEQESEESEEEEQDIDFKKELEKVETTKPTRSEEEKAVYTLKRLAQRVKDEFGKDPATILNIKPKIEKKETEDVESVVQNSMQKSFNERDARQLAKNEDHFKLIMHYVENNKLSVPDAYVLSMKGALLRKETEIKRGLVTFASPNGGSRKVVVAEIPRHPAEDLLIRRGLTFNPKTKTYQGKFTEEYYDTNDKTWKSRKISK